MSSAAPVPIDHLKPGEKRAAIVLVDVGFGVIVDLGGPEGIIYNAHLCTQRPVPMQTVDVQLLEVDLEGERVILMQLPSTAG